MLRFALFSAMGRCRCWPVLLMLLLAPPTRAFLPLFSSQSGASDIRKPSTDMRNETRQLCEEGGGQHPNYSHIDVVVVTDSPVCVTQQVIKLLLFNFRFRHLYYIVKYEEYCPYLESIDPTVRCMHESKILPGLSYHSLKAASPNLIRFQGQQLFDRVRWYFQQYLKLGVALHLEGLSEHYLVWDADSIPIKPFPLLADDGRVQLCATPSSKKAHDFGKFYKALTGMDSHHPHQDGRVFTFVCGYMLFHKPTVVEMLAHITSHLSGKEARHSPPALVPPAAASSEVATASPKGTSAKAAAKVAKVEPAVTEAQRKVAEKATEATEAVSQPPKGGVAAEPAADATPTAAELAQAAQAAEVEDAGDDERGGGLESESGELMDDEEEVAMEVEPEVVLLPEQSMRLEQEAEMIAAKLAEARQRASEELQRVERLERLLNDALRSHEHEELDGAVVSISAELQAAEEAAEAEGTAAAAEHVEELRAQLQLAETNARDLESEAEAQAIASELDVLRQREAAEPGVWVDGMPISERMQELEAQLRLAQQVFYEGGGAELEAMRVWEEATGVGQYSATGERDADIAAQPVYEEEGTVAHLEMEDNMEENVGAGMEMAELTVEEPQAGVPEELQASTGADDDGVGGGGHDMMEDMSQVTHDSKMAKLEALAALSELEESQEMDQEELLQQTVGYRPMRPKALNALTANAQLISTEDEQARRKRRRRLLISGARRLVSVAAMHGLPRWKGKGGSEPAATTAKANSTPMLMSTTWTAEDDARYHAMVAKGFPWNVHAVAEKLISSGFMFSEFDSYGSWVMQHQPSKFAMDYKISYVRNPGTMLAPQTLSKGVVARRLGQSAPQPGVPTFLKNVKCCLNHKRICELGKAMAFDTNGGPRYPVNGTRHHILIWDEHKFRYLGSKDHCVDPLPTELIAAKRQVEHARAEAKRAKASASEHKSVFGMLG